MIHAIMVAMIARFACCAVVASLACTSASCTRLGFDDPPGDGTAGDASFEQPIVADVGSGELPALDFDQPDSPPTQPSCDWTDSPARGAPVLLDKLNSDSNETDPFLAADGLTLYFGSVRNNVLVTMVARRPARGQPFGVASVAPAPINVPSGANERFELDAAGNFGVISGSRPGFEAQLFVLSLSSGLAKPIADLHTAQREVDPHLALKGQQLWFARQGTDGNFRILRAERVDTSFASAKPVAELNAATPNNSNATLDERGLLVVFAGCPAGQDCDIYYATRSDISRQFAAPRRWPGSDPNASEFEPYISRDGCELFFVRGNDPQGGWGLYHARYSP